MVVFLTSVVTVFFRPSQTESPKTFVHAGADLVNNTTAISKWFIQ